MRIFRHFHDLPAEARGAAVAIGNFDGLHRGHRAVIDEAGHIARAAGMPWAVLTFEPHPAASFSSGAEPCRLTRFGSKARTIGARGVDGMIGRRLDRDFSHRPAGAFVTDVLVKGLGARHVVSGYDFVFGHKRAGNTELLLHRGEKDGFGFTCVTAMRDADGKAYSSTRVRAFLKNAEPGAAAEVLGRHFEIEGRVAHGDHRGQAIGYPTANLHLGEYLRPANGVYAVRAGVDRGAATVWHAGVANLGRRPTFAGTDVILEVHLFDFDGDLYGRHLRVALVGYLRPEKKFDGLDDLKAQIAADSVRARHVLAGA